MKINQKNYTGIQFYDAPIAEKTRLEVVEEWGFSAILMPSLLYPYYLITDAAREVIDKIQLTRSFNLVHLQNAKAMLTILFNERESVRICRRTSDGGEWLAMLYMCDDKERKNLRFIPFALCTKHDDPQQQQRLQAEFSQIDDETFFALSLSIRSLLFLELTEPEILVLPPNKKQGTRKAGYYNDGDNSITIVDSTWNKFIVRTDGFGVAGHFRLQVHGPGRQQRKLIWINPFEKQGYVRKPKAS